MTNAVKRVSLLLSMGAALAACGGSGSGGSSTSGSCSGATPVSLTVKNYLSWCSVSVNGGAPSVGASQTMCVAAGSVPVTAQANTGFELGSRPWHLTTGDSGSGEQGTVTGTGQSATSATTVTVSGASACAWVCCETHGETDCPTTDLCP